MNQESQTDKNAPSQNLAPYQIAFNNEAKQIRSRNLTSIILFFGFSALYPPIISFIIFFAILLGYR